MVVNGGGGNCNSSDSGNGDSGDITEIVMWGW